MSSLAHTSLHSRFVVSVCTLSLPPIPLDSFFEQQGIAKFKADKANAASAARDVSGRRLTELQRQAVVDAGRLPVPAAPLSVPSAAAPLALPPTRKRPLSEGSESEAEVDGAEVDTKAGAARQPAPASWVAPTIGRGVTLARPNMPGLGLSGLLSFKRPAGGASLLAPSRPALLSTATASALASSLPKLAAAAQKDDGEGSDSGGKASFFLN